VTVCMPKPHEVLRLLSAITDERGVLSRAEDPWDLNRIPAGTHVTYLLDDAGETRGAVVTDINATVYLGGRLILMPETDQLDMARRLEVDESLTDAVSEVLNMTRSVFNHQEGNEHLSPTPTRALETPRPDGPEAWLLAPSARLDLAGNCALGALRIAFLLR